ncbi:PREDICTED: growth-regulating factor 4-like [Populus euphratica]|uniref:Growth-regulating factor n=1 Tax=Populus euphratica TaxID=75702 RepID=A0AAJ6TKG5_POPEU|nr:PREDICTED: growth-regulating factor 4-like [Populus euphratica]
MSSGGAGAAGGGGAAGVTSGGMGTGVMTMRSPFTVSQWQELEHQALIYKYMVAGLPVPPDLVLPIQRSFESISHRFFHHPAMGYCTFYGKKVDPEPGRCRRTDGKKWRCSKDAYPDSKYCERHMHRGRNRSRKPVESQTMTQSLSTVTSLTVTGSSSGTGSFQSLPLHTYGNPQGTGSGPNQSHYHMNCIPRGIPTKDCRYLQGLKTKGGEHSFLSEPSGCNRGLQKDSQLDNAWSLMQSRASSFPTEKSTDDSTLKNDYPQHSFFSSDFTTGEPVKHEGQSLRPFFEEWPENQDTWSGLKDDRSNSTSFSTTKLSMSIPIASSGFSSSSRSPQEN